MKTNSKQFLSIQAKWDQKLKDSGFEDIEQRDGRLKESSYSKHLWVKEADAFKEEYYRLAGHFLYDYQFETSKQKEIWRLHSEGLSVDRILTEMRRGDTRGSRWNLEREIEKTIKQLAKVMLDQWKVPKE